MILDRVTITGADDTIMPDALVPITKEFPFVEWGILASANGPAPRFPSETWIYIFKHEFLVKNWADRLSLHLCGSWVRELLLGRIVAPDSLLRWFNRIQLNFHAEGNNCYPAEFAQALAILGKRDVQFIFQIDGNRGNRHLESLFELSDPKNIDAVALFDISGGAGSLPDKWPKPQYMVNDSQYAYHGYAGGLGPHNLAEQLPLIAEAAGDTRIWIDMETHVRSDNGKKFDLDKVRKCLEIAAPYVSKTPWRRA